jgi:ferredoxin
MRVWIDQDLCTGDGLCTDHCPEVFMLLEDGMSYVREAGTSSPTGPGQDLSIVPVARALESNVIDAALECPGECIFVEEDATYDRTAELDREDGTVHRRDELADALAGAFGSMRSSHVAAAPKHRFRFLDRSDTR